ncbi:hypothetical protein BJV74DRAFT_799787, partial [Russula compacta]
MSAALHCFGAVTNPEDESVPIPTSAKEIKRKHTSDNTASKDDDALEALQSPPKPRCGRPPAEKKALDSSKAKRGQPPAKTKAPTIWKSHQYLLPNLQRGSPEPLKEKHSRPPVKKKATEVIAPKAEAIETLAEMELQEELKEEAEEYSVVRKQLDDEDIKMQPGDGEGKGASVGEPPEDDHETDGEEKVAPKPKQ